MSTDNPSSASSKRKSLPRGWLETIRQLLTVRRPQPLPGPIDDIRDLYIGRIAKAEGLIQLQSQGPLRVLWEGEVLFYGHPEGGRFVVERLRRIALYGSPLEPQPNDPIGTFSLVGPLAETSLQPGPAGSTEKLRLQIHYRALSVELPPLRKSEDAVFPQVEQVIANLQWKQNGEVAGTTVQLDVELEASEWVERKLDILRSVKLEPVTVSLRLAGSEKPPVRSRTHDSLAPSCPQPPATACSPGMETVTRTLPLKFISFSNRLLADVENLCKVQLSGVCEVWRNKAALDQVVGPDIKEGTNAEKGAKSSVDQTQEYGLGTFYSSPSQVEIYLVDRLLDHPGGGIAYDAGQSSAFCILALDKVSVNPYLLGHELGHVLGLDHPGGAGVFPGSAGSIMEPATPNSPTNTLHNFRVLTAGANATPLNPIVATTTFPDCFHPDGSQPGDFSPQGVSEEEPVGCWERIKRMLGISR